MKILEKESFEILFNNKKEEFYKDFDKNYSNKDIENYSLKKSNPGEHILKFISVNIFFMITLVYFMTKKENVYLHNIVFILLLLGSFCPHFLLFFPPVKKIINKISCKKKNNIEIIKNEIFLDTIPDNYFLKDFMNSYGEDAIKEILKNKEVITYRNIEYYVNHFKELKKITVKEDQISQIVKCISNL